MTPADLTPGAAIDAGRLGPLTVVADPFIDLDTDSEDGRWTRVYVDVQVDPAQAAARWDADLLPGATGAEAYTFLTMTNGLRYRLTFLPDDEVEVCDA